MKEWRPVINEELISVLEYDNPYDQNSVAFLQQHSGIQAVAQKISFQNREQYSVQLAGHIPVELSTIAACFIRRGGTIIAIVMDPKMHRSNKAEGNLNK